MLLAVWLFLGGFSSNRGFGPFTNMGVIFLSACTFLTVPVIGLYFSLRCRNFVVAFLATGVTALLVPGCASGLADPLWWLLTGYPASYGWDFFPSILAALCQFFLCAACWVGLWRRLRHRTFATFKVNG